jgi:hypothetical protein
MRKALCAVTLSLCFLIPSIAGAAAPGRWMERAPGLHPLDPGEMDRFDAIAVGKPPALSALASWVTSDQQQDEFTTFYLWCDFESLSAVQFFYTSSTASVKVSIKVTSTNGTVVHTDDDVITPTEPGGFYFATVIGPFAGGYKLAFKIVQGLKVVAPVLIIVRPAAASSAPRPERARAFRSLGAQHFERARSFGFPTTAPFL